MGFGTGFILGVIGGAAWALLVAPSRGEETRERLRSALAGEEGEPSHDGRGRGAMGLLDRAVRTIQQQVEEALTEARQAAEEAKEEMQRRYQERVRRRGPRGERGAGRRRR